MKKLSYLFCLLVFALPILNINIASASSGACSYHGGVNCSAGADYDGSVICNDGWTDSSISYSSMSECSASKSPCPIVISDEQEYNKLKQSNDEAIARIRLDQQNSCESYFQKLESSNNQLYQSCVGAVQSASRLSSGMNLVTTDCDGEKSKRTETNQATKNSCLHDSDGTIFKYQTLNSCLVLDKRDSCTIKYKNTHTENNKCVCDAGYTLSGSGCVLSPSTVADNPFAHILGDALKNTTSVPVTSKKKDTFDYRISSSADELNSSTGTVKKTVAKKEIKVTKQKPPTVSTSTIIATKTLVTTHSTTTPPALQNKPKSKWYSSFFSSFF